MHTNNEQKKTKKKTKKKIKGCWRPQHKRNSKYLSILIKIKKRTSKPYGI